MLGWKWIVFLVLFQGFDMTNMAASIQNYYTTNVKIQIPFKSQPMSRYFLTCYLLLKSDTEVRIAQAFVLFLVFRKKDLYLIITQKAQSEMRRFSYEMWHFSYEMQHFSYEMRCFSYEKHCTFHEIMKSLKTADSTQISHLDLVFHRVQREGHSWKASLFMWKAPLFERPLARNCNPMFVATLRNKNYTQFCAVRHIVNGERSFWVLSILPIYQFAYQPKLT